ncbi:MAG: TolC family protein [Planctomycetota bacterium]|nr:TolC family protein [Planctomycetota bacterium]
MAGPLGCASLDPTADLEAAASSVQSRTGIAPDWAAPWDELSPAWDGETPLSSDAAVIAALQNNREIRREVESIVAARADYVQAHLLPNPVINIALGFPIDGGGGDPLAASLIQQLAWLWQRPARIDAADADLRRRILAVSDAVLRVVAQVRAGHADIVYAEHAVELQQRNCDLIEQSLELVRLKFEVGEATQLDVNRVRLDLLQARAELVERTASLDVARRRLLEQLGRADRGIDWMSDGQAIDPGRAIDEFDEAEVLAAATRLRLDAAAASMQVNAAEHRHRLGELGAFPDLGAGARYERNFGNREAVFPAFTVTPKLLDDNSARIARAESELRAARIEADRVLQQAQREVRTAWIELESTVRTIDEYQEQVVALATENAALSEEAFAAGTVDLTVLLDARREQTAARLRLNDLRASAARKFHELERAAGGTLDPQTIETLTAAMDANDEPAAAGEESTSS